VRIYLDCCCLNRPFDDHRNERVRIETAALGIILGRIRDGEWTMIGSDALSFEVEMTPDLTRRRALRALLGSAREWVELTPDIQHLATAYQLHGIRGMDALHLASAFLGRADVLLTVDARLYNRARRPASAPIVPTRLPAGWLEEFDLESDHGDA
jgi:hypothetical protein